MIASTQRSAPAISEQAEVLPSCQTTYQACTISRRPTKEMVVTKTKSSAQLHCYLCRDGADLVIVLGNLAIAKRGRPGTPQAKTWVSLIPGFRVQDVDDGRIIEVRFEGVATEVIGVTIH